MRAFKITIFILVVLVFGLVVLQIWIAGLARPSFKELPAFSPVTAPQAFPNTDPPTEGADQSNAKPAE